jgi:hypothetical protein
MTKGADMKVKMTAGITAAAMTFAATGSTALGQTSWEDLTKQKGADYAWYWRSPPWFANGASVHVGAKRTGINIDNVNTGHTRRCRFYKHTGPFGRYLTPAGCTS